HRRRRAAVGGGIPEIAEWEFRILSAWYGGGGSAVTFDVVCVKTFKLPQTSLVMKIEIADELMKKSGMSVEEILLRVAILLFQEEKLTLGQAADLAGLHQIQFQRELAKRNIPIH